MAGAFGLPFFGHAEDVGVRVGLVEGFDELDGVFMVDVEQDEVRVEHLALSEGVAGVLVAYGHSEAGGAFDDA